MMRVPEIVFGNEVMFVRFFYMNGMECEGFILSVLSSGTDELP